MAPRFPLAAAIPCAVERYRVGKILPGIMEVVTLGSKLVKKFARQSNGTKALVLDSWSRVGLGPGEMPAIQDISDQHLKPVLIGWHLTKDGQ